MLKIKMVKLKGKAYLLSIAENNKTIYFNDGYISTREELNNIYKEYKNTSYYQQFKEKVKDLITIKEYILAKKNIFKN